MKDNDERYYRILVFSIIHGRFVDESWGKIDFKEEIYTYIK